MAPNKRKMLEAARKYAQKGSKERALKEYEALLKLDPRDAKLRLEVGDAHRRWGQLEEAVAAYRRVAEQYTDEGFDARAVAVYKQIQSLDPTGHAACEPLAELYQRMGLASEAISALQAAADGHAREGNKRHALDLLRRMVSLDPTNTTSRIKVADLLCQEKLLEEAASEYEAVCAELERQGETEAAGRALERLLELAPDRVDVLARLARNLLARGQADEAEAPARRASEREPHEIAHHELLADVYRAQKRDEKLAAVYRKIAELYRLRGDEEQARDIMQRFVPMEAFEAPARGEDTSPFAASPRGEETPPFAAPSLGAEASPFGAEPLEIDDPGPVGGTLPDDEFLVDAGPVTQRTAPPAPTGVPKPQARDARPAPAPPARPVPAPPAAARPSSAEETVFELGAEEGSRILGDPEALLAEASVYLRYGKRRQAIENLQAILARDSHHRGALEKLGDAYADDGDAAGAVAAWLRAGELARDAGDLEAMAVLRDRVGALDAAAAATLEPDDESLEPGAGDMELLGDELEDETPAAPPAPLEDPPEDIEIEIDGIDADEGRGSEPAPAAAARDEDLEIDLDLDLDGPAVADASDAEPRAAAPSAPASERGSTPESDAAAATDPGRIAEELEEAEFYLQQGLGQEARALFERVLAASPGHPLALVRLGELRAAAGEDPDVPGDEPAAQGRSRTPVVAGLARAEAEETDPDADGAWLAGDADPFLDDASAAGDAASEAPETLEPPESVGAPEPLDAAEAPAPAAPSAVAPGPAGEFDLAAEVSAALEEAAPAGAAAGVGDDDGFQAVFGAFKRGVETALGRGDHDAHYDLGIAYREMGLLDDAVAEFRSAMQGPERRIECLHMLGLCALEQNRPDEAIDLLAHALAAPDLAQEQALAIRFELGRAYEQSGDPERARGAWEKVASEDPHFCEVSELLAGLGARPVDPPAEELESFRDLIAEQQDGFAPEGAREREPLEDLPWAEPVEPDPDDSGAGGPAEGPGGGPRAKQRRRKISFV